MLSCTLGGMELGLGVSGRAGTGCSLCRPTVLVEAVAIPVDGAFPPRARLLAAFLLEAVDPPPRMELAADGGRPRAAPIEDIDPPRF